eukprot:1187183-Prorocentrum_minimum.AAC.2
MSPFGPWGLWASFSEARDVPKVINHCLPKETPVIEAAQGSNRNRSYGTRGPDTVPYSTVWSSTHGPRPVSLKKRAPVRVQGGRVERKWTTCENQVRKGDGSTATQGATVDDSGMTFGGFERDGIISVAHSVTHSLAYSLTRLLTHFT